MANGHLEIWARAAASAIPHVGGPAEIVYSGYRDRAAGRGFEFLESVAERFQDPAELDVRLAASDPLDAIFGRALRAAIESGLADKRIALGRVVAAALEDEAVVDRSGMLVDTLAQVEAPHIKALVSVREAVQEVKDHDEWPIRAAGAEHEIISHVTQVGNQFDDTVIRVLKNLGLIYAADATDEWFVHDLTPYGYELLAFIVSPTGGTDEESSDSETLR